MLLTLTENNILAIIWAVFIVATIIIELQTEDLVTIWFTIGAIGSLIAALCNAPFWLQIVLCIGIAGISLIIGRPIAKKLQKKEIIPTNTDRLIGEMATVTKTVTSDEPGEVVVHGRYWRALSKDNEVFEKDEKVKIEAISGATLIVTKKVIDKEEVIL